MSWLSRPWNGLDSTVTSRPRSPVSYSMPAIAAERPVEIPPVELDPATYTCPDDPSDLTALVLRSLGGAGLEVARAWLLPRFRSRPRPRPFEAIVTCPGPAGHPAPHQLTCSGTYRS